MKKGKKKPESIFDRKVKITIDDRLNHLKESQQDRERLEEANRSLRKMKSLPK